MSDNIFQNARTVKIPQAVDFDRLELGGLVEFSHDYFIALGKVSDDAELYSKIESDKQLAAEVNMVDKILALQVAIYSCRRTTGIDGSTIDHLLEVLSDLKSRYATDFSKEFRDLNSGRI
jgi:hypothetical protein